MPGSKQDAVANESDSGVEELEVHVEKLKCRAVTVLGRSVITYQRRRKSLCSHIWASRITSSFATGSPTHWPVTENCIVAMNQRSAEGLFARMGFSGMAWTVIVHARERKVCVRLPQQWTPGTRLPSICLFDEFTACKLAPEWSRCLLSSVHQHPTYLAQLHTFPLNPCSFRITLRPPETTVDNPLSRPLGCFRSHSLLALDWSIPSSPQSAPSLKTTTHHASKITLLLRGPLLRVGSWHSLAGRRVGLTHFWGGQKS